MTRKYTKYKYKTRMAETYPTNFATRLAQRLKALDMSQTDLAQRVGTSQGSISRLMNKSGSVTPSIIRMLAPGLGITCGELALDAFADWFGEEPV